MGIPLLRGRLLLRTDTENSRFVAVVNETMARQYWPREDALGKRFKIGDPDEDVPLITIVGIVGNVRQNGLGSPVKAEMYLPDSQVSGPAGFAPRDLVIRTFMDPLIIAPAVIQEIHAVDPTQAVSDIRTFNQILDHEVVSQRLWAALVAAFAIL